ncbi:MAG: hypothetical protein CMJ58_23190 [Planctomycetaceae bacterium]|nr:hypothetical protein [Planctomycetaceae bacterium]
MHRREALASFLALSAFPTSLLAERSEKGRIIPLKEIWAYEMPGTKRLSTATKDGKYVMENGADVVYITRAMVRFQIDDKHGQAFVVEGEGPKALPRVRKIFEGKSMPDQMFKSGMPLSLVFFTEMSGTYVFLDEVRATGRSIEIRYRFHPHRTRDATVHFALIPLGKLPPAQYEVELTQVPVAKEFQKQGYPAINEEWAEELICRPTRFEIR